jgi:LPXTG-site transpeptidase (sortase) family protein
MQKLLPALSRAMMIVGGLLILAGLAWAGWARLNPPPEPTITDQGAIVMAITAPSIPAVTAPSIPTVTPEESTSVSASPTSAPASPLASPTAPLLHEEGPTPDLLPDWTVEESSTELTPDAPTPTPQPPTPVPPTSTPGPTPTPLPKAEKPPTRIVAPSIGLDAKIKPMGWEQIEFKGKMYTKWVVPENAAGWHENSSLPGHTENVVLSGHHNIKGKVFRYVVDLEPGDEITLYADGAPYVYTVMEKYILKEAGMPHAVRKANAQWIMPTGDERLTLVTCWPYEWPGNTHRVVVVARPLVSSPDVDDQG